MTGHFPREKTRAQKQQPVNLRRDTLCLLLLATGLFLLLYRRFLFGNAVYLYRDIGSDSVASSYPVLVMLSRLFRNREFSFYTLSCGLGSDTTATFLQYINPLKGLLLFFDRDSMPAGLLLQLYLETLLAAWATFRFLFLRTKHGAASVIGGLLFAFSGYAVLWSQNLSYGVCVAMFALTMFAVEAFAEKQTAPRFLALTGVLALYLFSNYFFCYMTALFVIGYLPLRALFARERAGTFWKSYLGTALSAVCALALAAVCVVSVAGSFLGSVRTGDASRPLQTFLKKGIDIRMVYASLARLFSENVTGIGDLYTGPDNYYEIAVLAVSVLFCFAIFYLLWRKKTRPSLFTGALLCGLALALPVCRYILNLNWLVMRFSFWISFLIALALAHFLRELMSEPDPGALTAAILLGSASSAGILFVLVHFAETLDFTLSARTLRFVALFLLAWALLLVLIRARIAPRKLVPALLLLGISAEILVLRHDTLYLRLYLTKEQFGSSAFSETTDLAVRDLSEADPELYRISSTENSHYANEGLVDGFNGTTLYNNTNPASLRSLAQAHGTNEVSTPYFLCGYPQYAQFTLLGGRYLIRREAVGESFTEKALFERIASYPSADGAEATNVYRNKNALPFGYLLRDEISEEDYLSSDLPDRMELLTHCWYRTGTVEAAANSTEDGSTGSAAADGTGGGATGSEDLTSVLTENDDMRQDLARSALWINPHNLVMEETESGIRFTATGDDPYIYVYLNTLAEDEDTSNYLHMKVRSGKTVMRNIALYYLADETSDARADWIGTVHYNKYYPESLTLLPDGIAGFRFDIDDDIKSVTLETLELVTCRDPLAHFEELRQTQVTDISFAHDIYTATVTADEDGELYLVPLLYLSGWSAEVNGEPAEVLNACGGLTGVRLREGTSRVTLTYRVPHFRAGLLVTLAAAALYLLAWAVVLFRRRRR